MSFQVTRAIHFHCAKFGLPVVLSVLELGRDTRQTDGRTDGQTDRQTDTGAHFIVHLP